MDVNYVIMPWGRVGSHLLIDVFRQAGGFRVYKEPETGIRTNAATAEAAARQQSRLWDELGLEARQSRIMCNVNLGAVVDADEFFGKARKQRGSLIYLDRRNVVKTAISIVKAKLYAEWHKQHWGAAAWAVKDPTRLRAIADEIDINSLRNVLTLLVSYREKFHAMRKENPGPLIYYEDMQIDLHGVVRFLCQELNRDMFTYEVRHFKAVGDDLRTEITNFDDIGDLIEKEFRSLSRDLKC